MNLVHMLESFCFRNHVCMTFELLSMNLYELIKKNRFQVSCHIGFHFPSSNYVQGFSLQLVRKFAHSILQCLEVLSRNKIIHCDLKPENILLKQQGRSGLKVVELSLNLFFTSRQGYRFWLIMLWKEENLHIHTVSFLQSTRGHFGGGVFNRHRHVELRCGLP